VHHQLGLASRHSADDLAGTGVGDREVKHQVLPSQLAQRFGTADVQRVLVAELTEQLGPSCDGGFEVEGIR
jgi:hypothetical protein